MAPDNGQPVADAGGERVVILRVIFGLIELAALLVLLVIFAGV